MKLILIFIFFVFMERAIPFLVRLYGVGFMPYGEEAAVKRFYRSYGIFSFPRSLFLAGILAGMVIVEIYRKWEVAGLAVSLAAALGWAICMAWDILQARKASKEI